jgi:hypothetical protein
MRRLSGCAVRNFWMQRQLEMMMVDDDYGGKMKFSIMQPEYNS